MSDNRLDLSRYVPGLVTFIANKLSAGASQCYRENFGIGIVDWRILSMLAVEEHIPAQRICQVVGLDKSVVSRALAQLEKDGFVRAEADLRDARKTVVSLTAPGLALHNRVLVIATARESLLLAEFTPKEQDELVRLLNVMHRRVEQVNSYKPPPAPADG